MGASPPHRNAVALSRVLSSRSITRLALASVLFGVAQTLKAGRPRIVLPRRRKKNLIRTKKRAGVVLATSVFRGALTMFPQFATIRGSAAAYGPSLGRRVFVMTASSNMIRSAVVVSSMHRAPQGTLLVLSVAAVLSAVRKCQTQSLEEMGARQLVQKINRRAFKVRIDFPLQHDGYRECKKLAVKADHRRSQ